MAVGGRLGGVGTVAAVSVEHAVADSIIWRPDCADITIICEGKGGWGAMQLQKYRDYYYVQSEVLRTPSPGLGWYSSKILMFSPPVQAGTSMSVRMLSPHTSAQQGAQQ